MKAWWAEQVYDDWGMFIHGETAGKAKSLAMRCEPSGDWEYKDIRVTRRPKLDNLPFTTENVKGMVNWDDEDDGFGYTNDCRCEICVAAAKDKLCIK